jgi:hypothetical protein
LNGVTDQNKTKMIEQRLFSNTCPNASIDEIIINCFLVYYVRTINDAYITHFEQNGWLMRIVIQW